MLFRQLVDPESSGFTYLVAARSGGEALLIDPVLGQVDLYLRLLEAFDLRLVFVVDTHGHEAEGSALAELAARTGCVTLMGEQTRVECVTRKLRDGETINIDSIPLQAVYTPGHTADSYSFVAYDRVFTGDTLLIRGTGRTDLDTGDARQQFQSLRKLLKLPGSTLVYPGHDYHGRCVSTIEEEKAHNPRLRVRSADEYERLMDSMRPAHPKLMDLPARPHVSWADLDMLKSS
jgi:sulfur dioxygenase